MSQLLIILTPLHQVASLTFPSHIALILPDFSHGLDTPDIDTLLAPVAVAATVTVVAAFAVEVAMFVVDTVS